MKSTNPLANLLRGSPFKPIQEHMRKAGECVAEVPALFEALIAGDTEELKAVAGRIDKLESEADQIKHDYRAHMPSTLLMPVSRRDLLNLLAEQDNVADAAEDIAKLLSDRTMSVHEKLREPLRQLVGYTVDAFSQAAAIIEELDELLEVGFGGRQTEKVTEMILELRHLEHASDDIVSELNRTVYAIEADINPVDAVFWYRIIELTGEISNHAENVGDRLLLLIAR